CFVLAVYPGEPARTVGWREPGFIHTAFMRNLWPNKEYFYKIGHELSDGTVVWAKPYTFRAPPTPGQNSLQRIIVFGDMGKVQFNVSLEFANYQPGSLNTTDRLIEDLDNYDIVFHIGDMPYANGYLSQWDQFTAQVAPISAKKPYMVCSGNHERDWPNTGGFFDVEDSGGECGVPAETMYYYPAENRANLVQSGLRDVPVLRGGLGARLAGGDSAVQVHRGVPLHGGPQAPAVAHLHGAPGARLLLQLVVRRPGLLRGARGPGEPAEAVAEVPRRHCLLRPRPQLRAHMPALPEPVRQQREEPLLGHHERDHLRRGRWRRQPPVGVHHRDPQVEHIQGSRLRVHQADGLQPLIAFVRVHEEQRWQGV
uniref:Purple acid phosphatase n=1 Tax=Aegilops tauschii subsp. strangulata TaxID=200361 RepID=A0A453J6C4_AEGTS